MGNAYESFFPIEEQQSAIGKNGLMITEGYARSTDFS